MKGFLIVYSIDSRDSFDEITVFTDQILRIKDSNSVSIVICGNKCDLMKNREISFTEREDLSKSFHIHFLETSAHQRVNIDEYFYKLVTEIKLSRENNICLYYNLIY